MRSESIALACALFLVVGCTEEKKAEAAPGRFAAVKKTDAAARKAERTFCEHVYPKQGEGAKKWVAPPEKPVPAAAKGAPSSSSTGWKWVNLWATWCGPCVEEMPLLGRWRDTLKTDGIDIKLELWSIDEEEDALKSWITTKEMPGQVRWMPDAEALGPALESFGVDKNSAIPIHLFVDAQDQIRCVRVGSVHNEDYGAIKTILADG